MADRKFWTLKEDALIARAVREHPERPHLAFKNIALLTGRTVGSVRRRYQRLYLNTGVMPKLKPGRTGNKNTTVETKPLEGAVSNHRVWNTPKKREKKLNALQRFGKWLFNI